MAWVVTIHPYNNGAGTWSSVTITDWLSFTIDHQLDRAYTCQLVIADADGSKLRGYNVDANDVYLGVAYITITVDAVIQATALIRQVIGNSADRTMTLSCEGRLSQLDEELITYDMREDLDGAGLRQSTIAPDYDDTDGHGIAPANNVAGTFYVYDKSDILTANAHNGMKMFLTAGMAGRIIVSTGAYAHTDNWHSAEYNTAGDHSNTWVDDNNFHGLDDSNGDFELDYAFKLWVTDSSFFVANSITAGMVHLTYYHYGTGGTASLQIYDDTANGWVEIAQLVNTVKIERITIQIPKYYLSRMVDNTNGTAQVRFDVDHGGNKSDLDVYYCKLEFDVVCTGHSSSIAITDGETYRLTVDTDLSADATKVWDGVPYCVAQEIYKHIASDETPGGLVDDGDGVLAITCTDTVEHTTGYSTKQYTNKTRLAIIKDLAAQDKAVFWLDRHQAVMHYKSTFGADTQQITDADVDSWASSWDYSILVNDYHVYGARIGTYEIYQNAQNAASIAKYRATRSQVIRKAGVVSDTQAKDIGTALAARDAEPVQIVQAVISGLDTTYLVGTIVEITSSYLWSTAAKDYIVYRWSYDSTKHKTHITLHPKSSIGLQLIKFRDSTGDTVQEGVREQREDIIVFDPITHEVA